MISRRHFRLQAAGLAAFLAACAGLFAYMWGFAGGDLNPASRHYRVQAVVPTAVALAAHADVRHAGVKIGEVADIATRGDNAVLLLELDTDHAPVYRDARVLVRTKTLLGENYVDLSPGTPAAGSIRSGGVLGLQNAGQAVQLDEILSTLDRRRRRALQRVLDGLGQGLDDRGGDLNRFLEGTAALVREGRPVGDVLAADREHVAALVDDLGRVMRALGDRRDAIRLLTRRSKVVSEAVAARDERLRTTLEQLPGFLRQARATTTHLGTFSAGATPVVRDLAVATEELAPAVERLRPAAAKARRTMRALGRFARAAEPMAAHLAPFARATGQAAAPLDRLLRESNPLQAYLVPYWKEFGYLFSQLRSASDTYDALGHFSHGLALYSRSSAAGGLTAAQERALKALLGAGGLSAVDTIGLNAYPAAGSADRPEPFSGGYPRLEADPPSETH